MTGLPSQRERKQKPQSSQVRSRSNSRIVGVQSIREKRYSLSLSISLSLSLCLSLSPSLSHTNTLLFTLSHTLSHTLTHTHTLTLSHSHTLSLSLSLTHNPIPPESPLGGALLALIGGIYLDKSRAESNSLMGFGLAFKHSGTKYYSVFYCSISPQPRHINQK